MIIATAFVRLLVISPHAYNGSTGTAIPVNAIHYVDKRTMYTDSHIEAQMLLLCDMRSSLYPSAKATQLQGSKIANGLQHIT